MAANTRSRSATAPLCATSTPFFTRPSNPRWFSLIIRRSSRWTGHPGLQLVPVIAARTSGVSREGSQRKGTGGACRGTRFVARARKDAICSRVTARPGQYSVL
jgi:hypothetical protein